MHALYGITYQDRSARRHKKSGIVERLNLLRLNLEHKNRTSNATLLAHTTFASNTLVGNRTVSSFEAVLSYTPAVAGLPCSILSPHIVLAHNERQETRALQHFLTTKPNHILLSALLSPSTPIFANLKNDICLT
jgi:hypothetical protein